MLTKLHTPEPVGALPQTVPAPPFKHAEECEQWKKSFKGQSIIIPPPTGTTVLGNLQHHYRKRLPKTGRFSVCCLALIDLEMHHCSWSTSCCSPSRFPSVSSCPWKAAVPPVSLLETIRSFTVMEADTLSHFILPSWRVVWFSFLSEDVAHLPNVTLRVIKNRCCSL